MSFILILHEAVHVLSDKNCNYLANFVIYSSITLISCRTNHTVSTDGTIFR